jgi:nucleotide-binding universal stress UspA family protein
MKTILVPTDFSPAAQAATEVAASIAMKNEAQLVLLHAVELPASGSFNVEGEVLTTDNWEEKIFSMKLIEGAKQKLERLSSEMNKRGAKTTHQLRLGSPFINIREIITRETVDLIVMGTAGHSKIREMIIGSNTEKVVRHAKCPVLTVHQAPGKNEFKNIVYATSLDTEEETFAKVVINTREMYDGTIHLVRINTPSNFQSDVEVKKDMQAFAKRVDLKNYTINTFNHYNEEEGIIQFAQDTGADLIALSTHGRTGFAHVIAGSIAEDLANHSVVPVLTYVTKTSREDHRATLRPGRTV